MIIHYLIYIPPKNYMFHFDMFSNWQLDRKMVLLNLMVWLWWE